MFTPIVGWETTPPLDPEWSFMNPLSSGRPHLRSHSLPLPHGTLVPCSCYELTLYMVSFEARGHPTGGQGRPFHPHSTHGAVEHNKGEETCRRSLQTSGGVGILAQFSKAKAICSCLYGAGTPRRGRRPSRVLGFMAGPSFTRGQKTVLWDSP